MISTAVVVVIVVVCVAVCAAGGLVAVKLRRGQKAETGPEMFDPEKATGPLRKVQVRRGLVVSWVSTNKSIARGITRGNTPKTIDSRRSSMLSLPQTADMEAELKALQESRPYRMAQEAQEAQDCQDSPRLSSESDVIELPSPVDNTRPSMGSTKGLLSSIDESDDPADMIKELSWATYNAHRPSNHALSSVIGSVTPSLEGTFQLNPPASQQSATAASSAARHGSASTDTAVPSSMRTLHPHNSIGEVSYSAYRSQSEGGAQGKKGVELQPLRTSNLVPSLNMSPSSAGTASIGPASPAYAPSIQSAIYKSPIQDITPAAPRPRKPSKLDLRGSFSRIDYNIPSPVTVSSIASPITPGGASIFSNQATLGVSTPRRDRFSMASSKIQANEFLDMETSTIRSRSRSSRSHSASSRSTSRSRKTRARSASHRVRKRPPPLTVNTSVTRVPVNGYSLDAADQEPGLYTGVFPSPPPSDTGTPNSATLTALPQIPDSMDISPAFAVTPAFRVPLYINGEYGPPPVNSIEKLMSGASAAELARRGSDGDVVQKPKKAVRGQQNPSVPRAFSTTSVAHRKDWPPTSITSMLAEAHGMAQSTEPITPAVLPQAAADNNARPMVSPRPILKTSRSTSANIPSKKPTERKSSSKPKKDGLFRSLSSGILLADKSPVQDETSPKTVLRPALKTSKTTGATSSFSSDKALPSLPDQSPTTPPGVQRVEVNTLRVEHPDAPLGRNASLVSSEFSRSMPKSVSVALRNPNWKSQSHVADRYARTGSGRGTIGLFEATTVPAVTKSHRSGLDMIAGAIVADGVKFGIPTVTSRELRRSQGSSDGEISPAAVSTIGTPDVKARGQESKVSPSRRWETASSVSPLSTDFPSFVKV